MTQLVHRGLGLSDEEYDAVVERLGRAPSHTELAMFSVMWSEHCSYKSSRSLLRTLPSHGAHVLVGPGEGAGVVEVAPGVAVAWKVESHNHPSFVEPHNGAGTGVGGIVRDVLSMGARPVALLDSLRFGSLDDAHSRYLVHGVVGGISSYGNSIGVPTVGGETMFDACYAANPLVNVACLGLVEDRLMSGVAEGEGSSVVLFGSSTGRDGIGGASVLASAAFDADSASKRPSVQIGDPFSEKLLIEATLELVARGLLVGLQDLGAGGISCPASEMAAKAATGIDVDVDAVHLRERDMEPFEVMISESQERMMAVAEPGRVPDVLDVCRRWGVEARVIGTVTASGCLRASAAGHIVAECPVAALAEGPVYARPARRPTWLDGRTAAPPGDDPPSDLEAALCALLASPNLASRRWVWEQYDHMIGLGTVVGPGADAAVIRLPGVDTAVALSVDGPGRACRLDPYRGALLAVAEAARNVACSGARPLAITNCLNLGSPEDPGVMWQLAEIVRGVGDACRALGTPVTGGNVSFYNETSGRPIDPTPVIGMLGALTLASDALGHAFREAGDAIVLLGDTGADGFAGSEYAAVLNGTVAGRPAPVDLERERALVEVLVAGRHLLRSAHDVSGGGLAICLAESAIAGGLGFAVTGPSGEPHRWLFSESSGRVVVSCAGGALEALSTLARRERVPATVMGHVGGSLLDFGSFATDLEASALTFEDALPAHLSARVDR
ncbi:MAG: phosphoribosylformylglycinamidine synthase subunit PurL [Actinomycetota bacterium]